MDWLIYSFAFRLLALRHADPPEKSAKAKVCARSAANRGSSQTCWALASRVPPPTRFGHNERAFGAAVRLDGPALGTLVPVQQYPWIPAQSSLAGAQARTTTSHDRESFGCDWSKSRLRRRLAPIVLCHTTIESTAILKTLLIAFRAEVPRDATLPAPHRALVRAFCPLFRGFFRGLLEYLATAALRNLALGSRSSQIEAEAWPDIQKRQRVSRVPVCVFFSRFPKRALAVFAEEPCSVRSVRWECGAWLSCSPLWAGSWRPEQQL
eukprot:scaffold2136_cov242-Pinguiococcus_pyrenoidosus.AAC.3